MPSLTKVILIPNLSVSYLLECMVTFILCTLGCVVKRNLNLDGDIPRHKTILMQKKNPEEISKFSKTPCREQFENFEKA